MPAAQKYTVDKDTVVHRIIDGEAVILNLEDGFYYSLNRTATLIWEAVNKDRSFGEILDFFKKEYRISEGQLKKDILELFKDLSAKGLIKDR